MIYEKYAILTKDKSETDKVMSLLPMTDSINISRILALDIILIDSTNGPEDWVEICKEEIDLDVVVIPLDALVFDSNAPKELFEGVEQFKMDADISDDINYFLDLVSEKGGAVWLTGKERQRLSELSKA